MGYSAQSTAVRFERNGSPGAKRPAATGAATAMAAGQLAGFRELVVSLPSALENAEIASRWIEDALRRMDAARTDGAALASDSTASLVAVFAWCQSTRARLAESLAELARLQATAEIERPGVAPAADLSQETAGPARVEVTALQDVERRHIERIVARAHWRIRGKGGAAELLDMKPTTLESRMQKLGIRRPGRQE